MLREKLEKLRDAKSPFEKLPEGVSRGVVWVKPELVAQVSFAAWTADRLVRQAAFKGLREDKPARTVELESADADAKPEAGQKSAAKATHSSSHAPKASDADGLPVRLTHPEKVLDESRRVNKHKLTEY
jgi:bifunctional non-homologous end joining protein LigD